MVKSPSQKSGLPEKDGVYQGSVADCAAALEGSASVVRQLVDKRSIRVDVWARTTFSCLRRPEADRASVPTGAQPERMKQPITATAIQIEGVITAWKSRYRVHALDQKEDRSRRRLGRTRSHCTSPASILSDPAGTPLFSQ